MIVIAVVVVLGVFVAGRLMKANKEAQNTINTLCQFTDEKNQMTVIHLITNICGR